VCLPVFTNSSMGSGRAYFWSLSFSRLFGSYARAQPFLLCVITAGVATFPTWLAVMIDYSNIQ
jgi:hypothetical protein